MYSRAAPQRALYLNTVGTDRWAVRTSQRDVPTYACLGPMQQPTAVARILLTSASTRTRGVIQHAKPGVHSSALRFRLEVCVVQCGRIFCNELRVAARSTDVGLQLGINCPLKHPCLWILHPISFARHRASLGPPPRKTGAKSFLPVSIRSGFRHSSLRRSSPRVSRRPIHRQYFPGP
jgi:hypothetical protein